MSELTQFHNLAHICISFIGTVLLLAIYSNIRVRFKSVLEEDSSKKRVDKGLLYLSFGTLVWVVAGLWLYLAGVFDYQDTLIYQLGVHILSTCNNLFWLLALFYFHYAPKFIYHNEKNVKLISYVILAVAVVTIVLSLLLKDNTVFYGLEINALPDVLLSAFLCFVMGYSFYKTFMYRGLRLVAYVAVLVLSLMFFAQLPELFVGLNDNFTNYLIRIIAKTSLISLFLVLAATWVIELANTPKPKEMKIHFIDWSLIQLTVPSKGIINEEVDFGSKTTQFRNLLDFAYRRKCLESNEQCIVVNAGGEIKSQTYLTRIIDNINTILDLKNDDKLERKDLITFIGESKYRLRILPEHISIDKALLEEFRK